MRVLVVGVCLLCACTSSSSSNGSTGSTATNPSCGELESEVQTAVDSAARGCAVDADCTEVAVGLSCFSGCNAVIVQNSQPSFDDRLADIDVRLCDAGNCGESHGCTGFGSPVCHAGICVLGQAAYQPPGFVGYFHELGIPQALNLRVDGNSGTYAAALYGCNVQQAFGGTWFANGDAAGSLEMVHGGVETLIVDVDGGLLVTDSPLFFDDGGFDLLAAGAVCPVCDGGAGPTGLVPCDTPFGF